MVPRYRDCSYAEAVAKGTPEAMEGIRIVLGLPPEASATISLSSAADVARRSLSCKVAHRQSILGGLLRKRRPQHCPVSLC
jgi:hypothetical protein